MSCHAVKCISCAICVVAVFEFVVVDWFMSWHAVKCTFCAICVFFFEFVVVDWFMSCHAVKCISCAICVVAVFEFVVVDWFMSWHAVKCTFCAICVFFLSLLLLTGSCHGMQSSALLVPFVLVFLSWLL